MDGAPPNDSNADVLAHRQAIDQFAEYVALLREVTSAAFRRYSFVLDGVDGRWDLAELELPAAPGVGDLVSFADSGRWCVLGSRFVTPRPSGKPPREFFVCSPA